MNDVRLEEWSRSVIKREEIDRYLENGEDFIKDGEIEYLLEKNRNPDPARIRDIIARSLSLERLEADETAALLNVRDKSLWEEMRLAAQKVKDKVYGPRVVIFAPLYISNLCVNSCLYCGFRRENIEQKRRVLSLDEIKKETEALVSIGHKRLIVVFGEHPASDASHIAEAIRTIYGTKVGRGEIRRVNVNAPPLSIADYKVLKNVGIGTYQVFQETYHHETYKKCHPAGPKADYRWRLYALHRAQDAGVDDVAIGALFGLYDWRFEVMGLLYHTIDLERRFDGIGPHTISFPRLEPALNAPLSTNSPYKVSDEDFLKALTVIRLSIPYTGMIITAREPAHIRREALMNHGCTQTDASSRIGIGAYSEQTEQQDAVRQQFLLSDTRSLDDVTREIASMGLLVSFCTAGYRCGRTGACFMSLAKSGKERLFCVLNALITFKEYLLDYASAQTRELGERLIKHHIEHSVPENLRAMIQKRLEETENGKRDIRF